MLPIHSPALPMQAVTLRQPLDEAQQRIGITLRRPDLCVVNTKPLSSDTHSLKTETARKQSKATKTPSVGGEGKYLERAMAYVRECMSRHALACDMFVPRAHKELPDKVMEGLVTMDTMSARMYSPHAIVALMPLVPSHDAGLLPNSISPADGLDAKILPTATHDANVDEAKAGLHGPQVVNKEDKASMTHSPEDESVRAEELSLKPAKAAPGQPEYGPDLPSMGKQELLIGAANVKCSDEHPPYCEAPTLPVPVDPDLPEAADAKRPSQEAVNKIEMSILLRSPESPVALTPPMLADPLLAHGLPRSNQEPEFRLRWKPPDTGKRSTQHSYQAVNNRMQQSATRHSPPPGAAYMLPVSRYSPAYVTQPILPCRQSLPPSHTTSIVSHNTNANAEKHLPILTICLTPPICQHASAWASLPRLLNVEVVWRARCKPPDMFNATPQCSTTVISARSDMSVKRSPFHRVTLALPNLPLTSSARVISPCHLNNELVYRVRKPPDTAGHRLLEEAVNKIRSKGEQSYSPVSRHASALHARSRHFWPALASLSYHRFCKVFIVLRANRKGWP